MLGNHTMETAGTEVASIRRRNDIEKFTWRIHQYFVDFENRTNIEISTANRCHNFHVNVRFKIDVISTKFPRSILTSNRWRIDEDESIGSSNCFVTFFNKCFWLSLRELKQLQMYYFLYLTLKYIND